MNIKLSEYEIKAICSGLTNPEARPDVVMDFAKKDSYVLWINDNPFHATVVEQLSSGDFFEILTPVDPFSNQTNYGLAQLRQVVPREVTLVKYFPLPGADIITVSDTQISEEMGIV
jgi:hypothetical protein